LEDGELPPNEEELKKMVGKKRRNQGFDAAQAGKRLKPSKYRDDTA